MPCTSASPASRHGRFGMCAGWGYQRWPHRAFGFEHRRGISAMRSARRGDRLPPAVPAGCEPHGSDHPPDRTCRPDRSLPPGGVPPSRRGPGLTAARPTAPATKGHPVWQVPVQRSGPSAARRCATDYGRTAAAVSRSGTASVVNHDGEHRGGHSLGGRMNAVPALRTRSVATPRSWPHIRIGHRCWKRAHAVPRSAAVTPCSPSGGCAAAA